jgi:2-polyprenyl-3-methyl-5-hydroxy-6-metoxy-1,4-benzoquinol methylase
MSDDIALALRQNRETLDSYERCAEQYAQNTCESSQVHRRFINRFIRRVGATARVLEIGSGPGWDADHLEANNVAVVRTDITQAFINFQQKRGKRISRLNVIEDDIEGVYDGILCLYVLQHVARSLVDSVLNKFTAALSHQGVLLLALREGDGEFREVSASADIYHTTLWSRIEFATRLERAGFEVESSRTFGDEDGEWLIVLARKRLHRSSWVAFR